MTSTIALSPSIKNWKGLRNPSKAIDTTEPLWYNTTMSNNLNNFDHFDTHIHSDELIPDGYEDFIEDGDWELEGYDLFSDDEDDDWEE